MNGDDAEDDEVVRGVYQKSGAYWNADGVIEGRDFVFVLLHNEEKLSAEARVKILTRYAVVRLLS